MSLMKMLKCSGQKIKPCGMPASTFTLSIKAMKELFILQCWTLFVRWPLIKVTELLSKPYALKLASSISSLRSSKSFR